MRALQRGLAAQFAPGCAQLGGTGRLQARGLLCARHRRQVDWQKPEQTFLRSKANGGSLQARELRDGKHGGSNNRGWLAFYTGGVAAVGAVGISLRDGDEHAVLAESVAPRPSAIYEYVVVGAGLSAAGAIRGIRESSRGSILVLTRGESMILQDGRMLTSSERKGVEVKKGLVVELDVDKRILRLHSGEYLAYEKGCLLATGCEVTSFFSSFLCCSRISDLGALF